jgi:pyrroline-5-carboxylate reductase
LFVMFKVPSPHLINKPLFMQQNLRIGFIGTGRIAQALIGGISNNPKFTLFGYDKEAAALAAVAATYPLHPCSSIVEVGRSAEVIILAVKPYQIAEVLAELKSTLQPSHLLISVAAGISTTFMAECTSPETRIVRAMPNTPMLVGLGMTALCRGTQATSEDMACAVELFSAAGRTVVLDEVQMDGATAVSGSGPAYMFYLLEALAKGGEACGLAYADALLLASQTMLGAATMAMQSNKSPAELQHDVTTPGGTTEAGLRVMDVKQVSDAMQQCVAAAAARSRELMK